MAIQKYPGRQLIGTTVIKQKAIIKQMMAFSISGADKSDNGIRWLACAFGRPFRKTVPP